MDDVMSSNLSALQTIHLVVGFSWVKLPKAIVWLRGEANHAL
jgi:hypothetical protein